MLVLQNRLHHTPPSPPPVSGKTYQFGQWVILQSQHSHSDMNGFYTPNLKGFIRRYAWNHLEPGGGASPPGSSPGTYDFSDITFDLNFLASHSPPLYLIAMIEDKSFPSNSADGPQMLPAYLDTETFVNHLGATITGYEHPNGGAGGGAFNGWATLRWKSRVQDRYNALTTAMAAIFDDPTVGNNRYFLGIATQESAAGSDVAIATYDYTATDYRDSYKNILKSAANSFNDSYVHWIFNFIQGNSSGSYLEEIPAYVALPANCPNQNVLCGGPDFKPWDATLNGPNDPFTHYEAIRNINGITNNIKMFCTFSDPEYDGSAIGSSTPVPHRTVGIYSTISSAVALKISATAVVGGKLQITVPCTNAQSSTTAGVFVGNPYVVNEYVQLDDGTAAGTNVIVQSTGGSSGAYTCTFTTNPAGPWVGKTAARYWNFDEYYLFARGVPTPDFTAHAVMHLRCLWWYPSNSTIYGYSDKTVGGVAIDGAETFIANHATVWP